MLQSETKTGAKRSRWLTLPGRRCGPGACAHMQPDGNSPWDDPVSADATSASGVSARASGDEQLRVPLLCPLAAS